MKIAAPLNRLNEINALVDAGADELYCGLIDRNGWKKFAAPGCLSKRAEIFSNLNSLNELEAAAKCAHKRNVHVVLVLNEYYNESQAQAALYQAHQAIDCGVDALLVADLGLIFMLRNRFKKTRLYLSSCATPFNLETIKFYMELGISRIVFHRHLNIDEIISLKHLMPQDLDVEVFILNERCYNIDGYCSFQHGNFSANANFSAQLFLNKVMKSYIHLAPKKLIQLLNRHIVRTGHVCCFTFKRIKNHTGAINENNFILNSPESFLYACGICAIYDFHKAGISYLKIAGRSILYDQVKNVSLVKDIVGLLGEDINRESFISKAREIIRIKYKKCKPEYCYYGLK